MFVIMNSSLVCDDDGEYFEAHVIVVVVDGI